MKLNLLCYFKSLVVIGLFAIAINNGIPVALADDLQGAIKDVGKASDEELRAELQRRFDARRAVPRKLGTKLNSRDLETGLKKYDDATLVKAIRARPRVIYGPDGRRDWWEIYDDGVKGLASASVALFSAADIETGTSGTLRLKAVSLGERIGLCPDEKFAEQAVGAFCSGTLVKDDVVLTAGHCVREISNDSGLPYVNSLRFVFGFHVDGEGQPGLTDIPQDQIFNGLEVLAGELDENSQRDWALVKLSQSVPASLAAPAEKWRQDPVEIDQDIFVIGYPSGLPLKYAPGSKIRDTAADGYFVANLDTFGGNSGSGVFDAQTRDLIGVLVRGETDYFRDNADNCMRVYPCTDTGCRGEDVTRISLVPKP